MGIYSYKELKHIDNLIFHDKFVNLYGCDQEWFPREIQRLSGCGPTVASDIVIYNMLKYNPDFVDGTKEDALSVMNYVWDYVTPGINGIPSGKIFTEKFKTMADANKRRVEFQILEVPEDKRFRPDYDDIANIIKEGLISDQPVAFLNIDSGHVKNLDDYHWVVIIGAEFDNDDCVIRIFDEGVEKELSISEWESKTVRGGALVYLKSVEWNVADKKLDLTANEINEKETED